LHPSGVAQQRPQHAVADFGEEDREGKAVVGGVFPILLTPI